jgi:catechol 2,3-dioxygenase-like lactoylglutathione lyase family enzyme
MSMHTITPHLVVRDAARAVDWYTNVLGAEEGLRIPVPGRQVDVGRASLRRLGGHAGRGLAQHLRDVSPEELLRAAQEMFATESEHA